MSQTARSKQGASAQHRSAAPATPASPLQAPRSINEEAVRLLAYQRWEAAGRPDGDPVSFWLEAERELG